MKKTKFLTLLASIATLGFFTTSCSKDDAPTISLLTVNATEVTTTGQNIAATSGVAFPLKWAVSEGSKKLTKLVVRKGTADIATFTNADSIASGTYSATITTAGTYEFAVIVTDKGDNQATSTFNVVVTDAIGSYTTVLLNNQSSTTQSFYNLAGNVVYSTLADAKANSAKVDFIHIIRNSAKGGRLLVAPSDPNATDIYAADASNSSNISTWSTRNATTLAKVSVSDWTNLTVAQITTATTSITATSVSAIVAGDYIAFVTAAGTKGIAKVTAVSGNVAFDATATDNSGSITLDVKYIK